MVRLNRIYTRTGDDGTTGLADGSRIAKSAALMTAIGDVDEANSAIGLARREADGAVADELARIQNDLFDLGADLATPWRADEVPDAALRVTAAQVARLERAIDALNAPLAPLTSFVLPAGDAAALHLARAIARRAERSAVAADAAGALNPHARAYLNRLSDFLFVAARHVNQQGAGDVLWVPGAQRTS